MKKRGSRHRVQSPSTQAAPIEGPYLVIVVVGQYPEAHGYAPLRAYAQPILSGHRFLPIQSAFERPLLRSLIAAQRELDRLGIDCMIEKPMFDRLTILGACRPDVVVEARSRLTGEVKQLAVQAIYTDDLDYLTAKRADSARIEAVMPVLEIGPGDVDGGRIGSLLAARLDL